MENNGPQNNEKPSPKVILVVDDERSVLQLIKTYLEMDNYVVFTMETAQEALDTVRRMAPYAVLLDLGLPDMDGLEALWKIKTIRPSLCVVVVTGCQDEAKGRRAIELGAWDYVTKPIDFKYLREMLASLS